jgi:tetratricopeptide (TPR) repeat protein
VLAIEDVHWAAEPLVEMLRRTVTDVEGRVLLLATARPEGAHVLGGETLVLETIADDEAAELAEGALGAPLEAAARELVVRHAEGNPFFLEEVLSELLDRGLLEQRNGSFGLRDASAGLGIPDSVQGVLAARIDLLEPEAKRALQAAAVIGRSLSPAGLATLTGSAAEVRTLVERGFLRPTEPELAFKHALTREVAYASLPKAERARLHARYAEWLDDAGGDTHAGALAHHYAEAVDPAITPLAWREHEDELVRLRETALRWLSRAADLALSRFDLAETIALLRRAIDLDPDNGELWHRLGRANALQYDGLEYWDAMHKALELSPDDGTRAELYAELGFECTFRGAMWTSAPDQDVIEGWLDRALELAAPGTRARARVLIARGMRHDDDEATKPGIEIAEQLGDVELRSYGLDTRAATAWVNGEYEQAVAWADRRRELADEFTDPDHVAHIEYYGAVTRMGLARFDDARRRAQRHEEIAVRLNPHHALHAVALTTAIETTAGCWEAVRALQPLVEVRVEENRATPCNSNYVSLLYCAIACVELDDDDEAGRIEQVAAGLGMSGYDVIFDPLHARLALLRGELAEVARLLAKPTAEWWHSQWDGRLIALATRLDALLALGRNDHAEAEAVRLARPGTYLEPFGLRALGIVREDPALVKQAVERFEAFGLDWYAEETRRLASGVVGKRL